MNDFTVDCELERVDALIPPCYHGDNQHTPANALGIRHISFLVAAGLRARGAGSSVAEKIG